MKEGKRGGLTGLAVRLVLGGGLEEVREGGFGGVVGAQDVDVDDAFEGVGAQLQDGGEEVAGRSCAGLMAGDG